MPDITIAPGAARDVDAVARLHAQLLADSFLATLGERFLRVLYRRIARDRASTLLVARRGPDVIGFIAGTENTKQLYRDFIRRDAVRAVAAAGPGLVRNPRATLETLRYDAVAGSSSDLPAAELLALAVRPSARGRGVGARLVAALQEDFGARRVSRARVTVAADNTAALAVYVRCGYVRAARIEVHRGRASEVLVWG
ncbi:MAG: GNAT family N-acetyltransferase [Nocardioidaceae bacterium]|nr:GNAT family N-acetyltransferase [Nocardioidaceae bacterium]